MAEGDPVTQDEAPKAAAPLSASIPAKKKPVKKPRQKGSVKPGTVVHKMESPVFPVSDAEGYEVVGTWRYGRDLDIEPNGVFDVLHQMDPLSLLDAQTLREVVNAIETGAGQINTLSDQLAKDKAAGKPGAQAKARSIPYTPESGALNRKVLAQLRQHLTDKNLIDLGLAHRNATDPTVMDFDFRNFIAGAGQDGVFKLPINNAAYTLADLGTHTDAHICQCKAAEADLLLEGATGSDFLQVVPAASDDVVRWASEQAVASSASWGQSQDALRGQAPDRPGSKLVDTYRALFSGAAFRSGENQAAAAKQRLIDDVAKIGGG